MLGLESRLKRFLKEIITISNGIRGSAVRYENGPNSDVSGRLCHQMETIRISADAILQSFVKASLGIDSLDDQITDWLTKGGPQSCLGKLQEMNDFLRAIDSAKHPVIFLTPTEDRLVAAMAFFDEHKGHFHFLLNPDTWSRQKLRRLQSDMSQVGAPPTTNLMTTEHEDRPLSDVDQATVTCRDKGHLHRKLYEIMRWLAPTECAQKHNAALRLRQEGTCEWFPNMGVYEEWRAPGNHFLWLHGKAGCGKSVLIASTIEHLKNKLQDEEVVVFFYCDFQNKRSTSSTELMRSLLTQLLCHLHDRGVDPGDFPREVLDQRSKGTISLGDSKKLCDLVSRVAGLFRYEPMIVIDALDECADIETLLPALVTLSQSDVRLLVTSRPDQTFVDHFAGLRSLSLEAVTEEISMDIALHVGREVDSHDSLKSVIPEMKKQIKAKLTQKAEGRFLWVQCQLDTLKRCATTEELEEVWISQPNDIEATYERILRGFDERKTGGELARRVLALLIAAIEPLRLAQIVDGLSIDFEKRNRNREIQEWLESKLLHSLSSLVSYHEETDVLALSHYSVKEYLTGRLAPPMYQIFSHQAHAEVIQMCMGYISVFLEQESSLVNLEMWQRFPMLSYVLSSGFDHFTYIDSESTITLETLCSLGSDVRHHPSHWDRLCEFREKMLGLPHTPWPSSKHDFVLYILIAYSSHELLRTFLSCGHPLQSRSGTNPLVYAADLRKTRHAMELLAHGADMDARGLIIDDSHHASPLEVAIDLMDDVLVEELLQRKCLLDQKLLITAVCMPWCGVQVLAKLVQTDEFAELALGIGDEKWYRCAFSSARPNSGQRDTEYLVLARRLHQLGLDFSADSWLRTELAEHALQAPHLSMLQFLLSPDQPPPAQYLFTALTGDASETVSVVHLLLQKGIDVRATSGRSQDTALHLAARCLWEPRSLELTRLLVDAGCDPHVLNSYGETPLVIAVRRGHRSVAELLLSCGVLLPSDILHVALEQRLNFQTIEYLICKGADIHAISLSSGNTVLHRAVIGPGLDEDWGEREQNDDECRVSECLSLVKCFLEAGCDPTARNFSEQTPLEIAIERNLPSVVALLLSSNVPLPPDTLPIALRQGSTLEMIECLIHGGADVHAVASDGDTILHILLKLDYGEETCYKLAKDLINSDCNTAARNSKGETALEIAMKRNFTSVVELLLPSDASLPPDLILIALQQRSPLQMIEYLVQRGADVRSVTSTGDTVLHLALAEYRTEEEYCKIVRCLIETGCDPSTRNSQGNTVLSAAVERGYFSVVELLLSFDIPITPDILYTALGRRCKPQMIQVLVRELGANDHSLQSVSQSDWNTLRQLAHTSYSGQYHQQITEILEAARNVCRSHSGLEDETVHVAKKPRLW